MEYVLISEWYSIWYATLVLSLFTMFDILVLAGVVFVVSAVYDIVRQVMVKWAKPKTTPRSK